MKLLTKNLMAVLAVAMIVAGSSISAQTISMPTQGDITAAQLTATDIRMREQQQLDRGYFPEDFGFDNQFMLDEFNSFSGGRGGPHGQFLSPSMDEDYDNSQ